MKTGRPRIVVGIVLTTLFGLNTLRNLVVVPLALAVDGPTSYVLGGLVEALVAALIVVLAIRMIVTGVRQRRAYRLASTRPAVPGRF